MTTENQATDAIGVVNDTIAQTYAVLEDFLQKMGVDQNSIDVFKSSADVKGYIGNAAQVAVAYYEGDTSGMAHAIAGIATGVLVTAVMAAAFPSAAFAITVGIGAGIAFDIYTEPHWDAFWSDLMAKTDREAQNIMQDMQGMFNQMSQDFSNISSAISDAIINAPDPLVPTTVYVRRDPLILDLDGDGIEITPLSGNVMFDTNGDTIKTATAWVSGDDGILVWDRNGNGTIDSGAEIFGDEMIMSNGQKAQNGFEALKAMNSDNNGDLNTVFDARDGLYSAVRIWRDLNQDGISQANELQTLAAAGVASIGLSYGSPTLQNGSTPAYVDASMLAEGSFTRANGTVGQAGSFLLTQNNSIREFTPVTVSQAALVLPNIQGSGVVRDLREAA